MWVKHIIDVDGKSTPFKENMPGKYHLFLYLTWHAMTRIIVVKALIAMISFYLFLEQNCINHVTHKSKNLGDTMTWFMAYRVN